MPMVLAQVSVCVNPKSMIAFTWPLFLMDVEIDTRPKRNASPKQPGPK
jgi:hypothetical protein